MSKTMPYRLQSIALDALLMLFAALPPKTASALGGKMLLAVSPLLKAQNKRVMRHLALAFPKTTDEWRKQVRREMWENLGMIIAEYPHLPKFLDGHPDFKLEIRGAQNIDPVRDRPLLFVSAHIGNWEILPVVGQRQNLPVHPLYRAPNNPFVEATLENLRRANGRLAEGFPKSRDGLRRMIAALQAGKTIGALIDQRHSKGPAVKFFGHPAEVTTLIADLARKYDAVILPGRITRRGPCDFLFECLPAIPTEGKDSLAVIQDIYDLFEDWIRTTPGQWLWTHRRWGKKI